MLALLPELTNLLPFLVGGTGLAALPLSFLPNLQKYVIIALAVLLALAVITALWFKGEAASCSAGRISDAKAAQDAADAKVASAKADADKREVALQTEIAANRTTADFYKDLITNAPPPPQGCFPTSADRDASRALRMLIDPSATRPATAR